MTSPWRAEPTSQFPTWWNSWSSAYDHLTSNFKTPFYEQTNGAAMGSTLSPIIVNLYLEHLEQEAIQSAALQPSTVAPLRG